jgi:HEAT repeat protein
MIRKISITALLLMLTAAAGSSFAGGAPSVKKLAQQMNSGDANVRVAAAKELRRAKKDPKLTPIIVQACKDIDVDVRVYGYYAVYKADAREEGVVDVLLDGLGDPSEQVRRAVASALGEMNPFPNTVLPYMVKRLVDPDERVRQLLQPALSDMGGLGMGALVRHIETKDDDLRLAIVNTLGAMGPNAKNALLRLQKIANEDANPEIKEAAQSAMKKISKQ